jgi:hypothetical protein
MTVPRRTIVVGAVAVALMVVVLANVHLVYAAIRSQPDCIAHLKPGTGGERGAYSAAQSSC